MHTVFPRIEAGPWI